MKTLDEIKNTIYNSDGDEAYRNKLREKEREKERERNERAKAVKAQYEMDWWNSSDPLLLLWGQVHEDTQIVKKSITTLLHEAGIDMHLSQLTAGDSVNEDGREKLKSVIIKIKKMKTKKDDLGPEYFEYFTKKKLQEK